MKEACPGHGHGAKGFSRQKFERRHLSMWYSLTDGCQIVHCEAPHVTIVFAVASRYLSLQLLIPVVPLGAFLIRPPLHPAPHADLPIPPCEHCLIMV